MKHERPAGRRAAKAARAGLPKRNKAAVAKAAAPSAPPAAPPARWSNARRREARDARAQAAAEAGEDEEEEERADNEEAAAAPRRRAGSPSQHGSHFAHGASKQVNDEWQTTAEAWADVSPVLKAFRDRAVWQPFYYDGKCAEHLRGLGFSRVIHENADFFERCKDAQFMAGVDCIWDNPPYTAADTKDAVLRALVATRKPFCVLLPSSILYAKLFRDLLDPSKVQLVLPRRVRVCKTGHPPVPFKFMTWVCYDMDLPRDLYLVGE